MKKKWFLALAMFVCCLVHGVSDESKALTVWAFTDEIQTMIDNYYRRDFPEAKFDYSLTPVDSFPNKLDDVLANGRGAPDVFALEDYFVRRYVEQGDEYLLDLTDVYNEVKDKLVKYPVQVGTYNGKVYALSWEVCPGAMFYRRSLAKKYLGTDDPEEVQKYFSDWNKFLKTAFLLNKESGGRCVAVSSITDLFKAYLGSRKTPWVVDGKLNIDPAIIDYMKMCKVMNDKGLNGRQGMWSEGWFEGMKDKLRDEYGNRVEVFSYFLPTWGLHYVLKPNSPATSGDWAMIQGPVSWRWGGTWLAAYKNTKNPERAKAFIKYICTDDKFLEAWVKDTGYLISNNNVVNKIKDNYSEPYLGGQNHYKLFTDYANKVDGSLSQSTDEAIESIFIEAVFAYMDNVTTLDLALDDFKYQVNEKLGL